MRDSIAERSDAPTTHTRAHDPSNGPAYCEECSAWIQEWVTWPCPSVAAARRGLA